MRIPQPEVNVGRVKFGEIIQQRFAVENVGGETLVLQLDSKSCSCTTILPINLVPPAGRTEIVIETRIAELGNSDVVANFTSNDPRMKHFTLHLHYEGVLRIAYQPDVVKLNEISLYSEPTVSIRLESVDSTPAFKILSVSTSADWLNVVQPVAFPTVSGKEHTLALSVNASFQRAKIKEVVTITTDQSDQSVIEIPVEGSSEVLYKSFPAVISLGSVRVGEVVQKTIAVSRIDKGSFSADVRETEHVSRLVLEENDASTEATITVSIVVPAAKPGGSVIDHELILLLTDSAGREVVFPVRILGVVGS